MTNVKGKLVFIGDEMRDISIKIKVKKKKLKVKIERNGFVRKKEYEINIPLFDNKKLPNSLSYDICEIVGIDAPSAGLLMSIDKAISEMMDCCGKGIVSYIANERLESGEAVIEIRYINTVDNIGTKSTIVTLSIVDDLSLLDWVQFTNESIQSIEVSLNKRIMWSSIDIINTISRLKRMQSGITMHNLDNDVVVTSVADGYIFTINKYVGGISYFGDVYIYEGVYNKEVISIDEFRAVYSKRAGKLLSKGMRGVILANIESNYSKVIYTNYPITLYGSTFASSVSNGLDILSKVSILALRKLKGKMSKEVYIKCMDVLYTHANEKYKLDADTLIDKYINRRDTYGIQYVERFVRGILNTDREALRELSDMIECITNEG